MRHLQVGMAIAIALMACSFQRPEPLVTDGPTLVDSGPSLSRITISVETGSGGGSVTATTDDLDCGARCEGVAPSGAEVTFTATAPTGSVFVGWRGAASACARSLACTLRADSDLAVGARFAQQGTAGWAIGVEGAGVGKVFTSLEGTVTAVMSFRNGLSFRGVNFATGTKGMALAQFTPAGDIVWARGSEFVGETFFIGIAEDQRNSAIVLWGAYGASLDLGGPSPLVLPAGDVKDYFVVKYAADGTFQWQRAIHVSDDDDSNKANSIAIDSSGDIFVAGEFFTSIDLGDGPLLSTGEQPFVAKLAGIDGSVIWKRKLGPQDSLISLQRVATDAEDALVLVASFRGTVSFGGPGMTATGEDQAILKLENSTGGFSSQRQLNLGGTAPKSIVDLTTDPSNNIYVAIAYRTEPDQPVTFAGQTLAGEGAGTEIVIGKFSRLNSLIWATRFGTPSDEAPTAMTILGDGALGIAGSYRSDISFGSHSLPGFGNTDGFLLRVGAGNGLPTYASRIGGALDDVLGGLSSNGSTMTIGGSFQAQIDLAGIQLDAEGRTDGYLACIALPP